MSLAYRILYGVGFTPWDHGLVPEDLAALLAPLPRGRALDVGCGTGTQAIWLAQRGWDVVGVDVVPRAVEQARRRAAAAGARARFVVADASDGTTDLGGPFSLVLDYGCFHSVPAPVRDGLVRAYARCTEPGARLVLFAFPPRRGPGPRGAGHQELDRRLRGEWKLVETRIDEHTPAPRLLVRDGRPIWHVWERR